MRSDGSLAVPAGFLRAAAPLMFFSLENRSTRTLFLPPHELFSLHRLEKRGLWGNCEETAAGRFQGDRDEALNLPQKRKSCQVSWLVSSLDQRRR